MAIENKSGASPQPGQPNQPQAAQPAAQQRPAQQPAPEQRQANQSQGQEQGEGLGEALRAQHEARVTVPGRPDVDARLDNRQGRFRPPLEQWPAKPQQVDGPDLAHQVEHTRRTLESLTEEEGDRKGMYSPGPHGLSDESLRESGEPLYGPEGLSEAGPGSGS